MVENKKVDIEFHSKLFIRTQYMVLTPNNKLSCEILASKIIIKL